MTITKESLAEVIWETSRADEGTISATGANIVADAVLAVVQREVEGLRAELAERLDAETHQRMLGELADLRRELAALRAAAHDERMDDNLAEHTAALRAAGGPEKPNDEWSIISLQRAAEHWESVARARRQDADLDNATIFDSRAAGIRRTIAILAAPVGGQAEPSDVEHSTFARIKRWHAANKGMHFSTRFVIALNSIEWLIGEIERLSAAAVSGEQR